ncbi:MAG TPA: ATP-binding cassette domain-containing protein, partial [Candidatus Marinimicrobia bacterium]|nr:ATP-binding cassette domain-containing protein [Candidatus Neomarinimicrobiota bacterium]
MIRLKTVRWKNFLATGNIFLEVKLDQDPMMLIVGKNGAGKSTLIDAITFSLFGKPFKKVNKGQLVNSVNERDTLTEIEFSVGTSNWKVRRGIKPNLFEIYLNGNLLNQDAKSMDYQKYLEEKILKLNFKSFTQIVVLGSASFVPFMQLTANDRRVIIEDILDIGIFSTMKSLLKDRFITLKEEVNHVEYEMKLLEEKKKLQEKYVEELQQEAEQKVKSDLDKIKETEQEIIKLNKEIDDHQECVVSLMDSIKDKSTVETKNQELDKYRSQIAKNLKRFCKDKKFFEEKTNCPTCEQAIDEEFKRNKLKEVGKGIDEMNYGLSQIEKEVTKIYDRIGEISKSNQEIQKEESQIIQKLSNIQAHNSFIQKLNSDLKDMQNIDIKKGAVDLLIKELEELKSQRGTYVETRYYYDILNTILNDTGIKTRIVRKYLPVINNHVNNYLKDMDFFVNFQLDENFQETIKSRHRDQFSYYSFSEGEKKRIDIALLLTWRDIASMRNSVNVNLLILDEV